ncbi:LysM peptidoglycan-binding domain-containing protein [[Clostridium] innocuum]|nr:LysM peptidoglycan-binding domain-containing protein [[Clostridium] innocuum]MCR0259170.1 LysM peptidoglycan-binding domain-containing protein [[Clostridium] innocuum]
MKKRTIELSVNNRQEYLKLVVNPASIEFTDVQNNQQINLLEVGTALLLGNRGLIGTTLESFFPSSESPFYKRHGGTRTPQECKALIKKWKDKGMIVRLIISDMDINLAMAVNSFSTTHREGDDDIYFSLELIEYKTLNVPTVKVSTKVKSSITKRPATSSKKATSSGSSSGRSYTIKGGDTLWAIATRYYGSGTQYMKIYNANKSTIESAAKAHGFSSSQNGHWIWAGTTLTIP